jgi:hypothetical protein
MKNSPYHEKISLNQEKGGFSHGTKKQETLEEMDGTLSRLNLSIDAIRGD